MLRKATGMAGIVVFPGPFERFNEGFQSALESLALFLTNLLQLHASPRWGVYVHSTPAHLFTLVAVKNGELISQTGVDLPLLVCNVLQASQLAWPHWAHRQASKPQPMAAAWIVPDDQLFGFESACSPSWGPLDVAAECCLEASSRTQIPVDQLAVACRVHPMPEGQLIVKVKVCQQSLIDVCTAQLKALNLQLQVFTVLSQVSGLSVFLGLAFPAQQALHQRIALEVSAPLSQGALAC
jgi:hypothetical protein